jgi:predicted transcriptional regulator
MVNLQIRGVSDEVRDRLVALAQERHQSLQAYLFELINDEARRKDNLAVLKRFSRSQYGSVVSSSDVMDALREERAERDAALGGPVIDE